MNLTSLKSPQFRAYISAAFVAINGTWVERITLGWLAWEMTGSASFVGRARALEEATWTDGQLSFVTHSESTMGSETRTSTHRYFITREGEQLKVRYSTAGGFESPPPMVFTASPAK